MYEITTNLLVSGVNFTNVLALLSFFTQINGLISSSGITPSISCFYSDHNNTLIVLYLVREKYDPIKASWGDKTPVSRKLKYFYKYPSIFWLSTADYFLKFIALLGIFTSILGIFQIISPILSSAIFIICYLSFVVSTDPWLGLQMHVTIIETNFIMILGSICSFFNEFILIFVFRFLVWRIMLGCGACKYAGDETWRNGTAMHKHYYTQPLPNFLSFYFHIQPDWALRLSVWGTHLVEGPLTFLAFGNEYCRLIGFVLFSGLNLMINVSGNYGFLGILTIVQSLSLLDDEVFAIFFNYPPGSIYYESWSVMGILAYLPIIPYVMVSFVPLVDTFHRQIPWGTETMYYVKKIPLIGSHARHIAKLSILSPFQSKYWNYLQLANAKVRPFRIINRYAKFGSMSKWRGELIIEGSDDGDIWFEYQFKFKPGDINTCPPYLPGHLPELDWMIWFLPPTVRRNPNGLPSWFLYFLKALLEGNPSVLSLLKEYPDTPPKYIRTTLYDYTFSSHAKETQEKDYDENAEVGIYWTRKKLRAVHQPLTLQQINQVLS